MLLINLNGKWRMKKKNENEWIEASVPGSMYNDMLNAGKMGDPFFRDNELKTLELSNFDYEYERYFDVDNTMLQHDKLLLVCEGLDTLAEIFINGKSLAKTNNMHRTYEFDIKALLSIGKNIISVVFASPVKYITEKQKELPLAGGDIPGIGHLRKAHCMFGWDWGPKLPDMGIWRNISIKCYDSARLEDVYVTQKHEENKVELDVRVRLNKWTTFKSVVLVNVISPTGDKFEKKVSMDSREEHVIMKIEAPELWWPNGFGEHPLYTVEVTLLKDEKILDSEKFDIGLRTININRTKDEWGESFTFEVNGIKIFSMGADYIIEDSIFSRCKRENTEKLIKSCIKANFNTIRVWGGAVFPEDYFYDLCDRYGLLVWQDLMFACSNYNVTDEFKASIKQETIDNVKRLRHHASLALWCGNNEEETAWVDWGWSETQSPKLKTDYIKQFEILLPEVKEEVDPNSFYWLSSPSSGGSFFKPNDENYGDMHYWGVWHGRKPFTEFRNYFPRFMSEFGLQSFPSLKTVESFTLPEDRNIFSYVMENHQKSGTGNETILYYISQTYKYPKDFDSLLFASQLIQAEGIKYGVEHWRRNRGRCMGAIYWQLNDCWPVASWASIDYFGRWKALHYAAKRFFAPILVSACEEGTSVSLHVTNDTLNKISGKLIWKLRDSKSNIMETNEKQIEVNALTAVKCESLDFNSILDTIEKKRDSYVEFQFVVLGETVSSGTVLFVKSKHFNFSNPELKAEIIEQADKFIIKVTSVAYARFVELDLKDADAIFSDNYFDLSAGEVKTIEIDKKDLFKDLALEKLEESLKLRSLFDTFE